MGLLAAADMVLASEDTLFGFPEVKLGITPSMISPYIISIMGERLAQYYFLTGEKFNAHCAQQMGLVHQVIAQDQLMRAGNQLAKTLLQNSPQALQSVKKLLRGIAQDKISPQLSQKTAEHLAASRETKEALEGLNAFLEKRTPNWK